MAVVAAFFAALAVIGWTLLVRAKGAMDEMAALLWEMDATNHRLADALRAALDEIASRGGGKRP